MTRGYTLKRRAEQQAQTRLKIVEAAVDLHGTVGPANTSLSMVAERAGVQRNTLYAHFPDLRSLQMACSALSLERSPPPDAADWGGVADPALRLRHGLTAVYAWYGDNAELLGCVLRDAERHVLTREIADLRFGPVAAGWRETLGEGLVGPQRSLLHLALDFHGWRALVAGAAMSAEAAANLMAHAIEAARTCERASPA
ncbi:TetR/AcrR family transcriptional regulator [Brevundimonas sp.]|uniref:TetR/AcrR family transcriptional regulator n=1 Tax=Brevundimonas sp. TaxID=1871086 RepID=UPI002D4B2F7F|nr:TetR/AcrR family transcriptional regulator [Brevundimonas sp.]HYC69175.1 TetR/AcrR family transcriptional regulator [Brevundimonas sp.]